MSIAAIEAKRDAAIAALDAGDYAGAARCAMAAKLLLATTPNTTRPEMALAWNARDIDEFIAQCNQLATAAVPAVSGIRRNRITYARESDTSDG